MRRVRSAVCIVLALSAVCIVAALLALVWPSSGPASGSEAGSEARRDKTRLEFEAKYNAWIETRRRVLAERGYLSYTPAEAQPLELVALGPRIVPFIIEKFEADLKHNIWGPDNHLRADHQSVLHKILHKHFPRSEWPAGKFGDHKAEMELFVKWWHQGRRETPRRLAELYEAWRQSLEQGKPQAAQEALERIRDFGLETLPFIVQKIEAGDERLVPLVSKIMWKPVGGDKPTRASILAWWKANEKSLRLPDPPEPPEGKR